MCAPFAVEIAELPVCHVRRVRWVSLLVSVNLAQVVEPAWKFDVGRTGIDKRPAGHRVLLFHPHGEGDWVGDGPHHGGPDQAVYAYAREDAAWWAGELGRDVPLGAFGENLSTEGLPITDALIGERWAIGDAVLEVSCPRIPCRTLAGFWAVPDMIKRFTAAGRPGAYLRIRTEGQVGAGDAIDVVHRPAHGVTIGETFRALTGDRSLARRLLDAPELPMKARERARQWLAAGHFVDSSALVGPTGAKRAADS
jgi:MOSC domain-containing protein YiiM